jgi:hypothetical protein
MKVEIWDSLEAKNKNKNIGSILLSGIEDPALSPPPSERNLINYKRP